MSASMAKMNWQKPFRALSLIALVAAPILACTSPPFVTRTFPDLWIHSYREPKLQVLDLSFDEAIELAREAAEIVFPNFEVQVKRDRSGVTVARELRGGRATYTIYPAIIWNRDDDGDYGILYRYRVHTDTRGPSGLKTHEGAAEYARAFRENVSGRVRVKEFQNYNVSSDKGITTLIDEAIPKSFVDFKIYLDSKKLRFPFEGIWTSSEGDYTLGVVRTESDPRYKYYGFVLESRNSNWSPGEIKVKFEALIPKRLVPGQYWMSNKSNRGALWKTGAHSDTIAGTISESGDVVLIRSYPVGEGDFTGGSGTAWAVTDNGIFVTSDHVVEYASKILIGFKKDAREARVIERDKELDLVVLQIINNQTEYTPLPICFDQLKNGATISVMGYPLASMLGDDVRITEGIISSQTGLARDIHSYQISAAVQPGNSGGPVIDDSGCVIGVVASRLTNEIAGTQVDAINFAVKSHYLKPLLEKVDQQYKTGADRKMPLMNVSEEYKDSVLPVWIEY